MSHALSAGPEIDRISPSRGAKFSPNLHRWVRAQKRPDLLQVLRDQDGQLWIGHVDDDFGDGPWLHGCRLIGVLCNGLKERRMAYSFRGHFKSLEPVADFWRRYEMEGRCAIDPAHTMLFVGDESRWAEGAGSGSCSWCGKAPA